MSDLVHAPHRLAALQRLNLLDTPSHEAFDRLTRLCRDALGVPVAIVSVVGEDRRFFKSHSGLPEPWATLRETPLTHSFCQHVVNSCDRLVVLDAREHTLVAGNMAIDDLGVVAYAGIPLTMGDGNVVGAFGYADHIHPEDREAASGLLREMLVRPVSAVEYRYRRPDGEVRWLLTHGGPVRDAAGNVLRVVGTTDDFNNMLSELRPELSILFMSGYSEEVVERYAAFGTGTHFIPKPFAPAEFSRKVREVLDAG